MIRAKGPRGRVRCSVLVDDCIAAGEKDGTRHRPVAVQGEENKAETRLEDMRPELTEEPFRLSGNTQPPSGAEMQIVVAVDDIGAGLRAPQNES